MPSSSLLMTSRVVPRWWEISSWVMRAKPSSGVRVGLFEHDAGDTAAQRMEKIILNVIEHSLDIARLRALQKLLYSR